MMEDREKDELNALTSQVLDYYKTYSQNRNFSSYLRGTIPNSDSARDNTSTIEVSEVANDEEGTTPFLSVQSDNDENNINLGNVIEGQSRIPSPTSSVTSNRKLEWDNLADIGYGNCRKQKSLHKSLSLPLLTTLERIQLGQRKLHVSPESSVMDHGTQTQRITKNSPLESVSSESYKKSSLLSTNTTSSVNENVPTIDTSSTVSSLSKLVSLRTETDLTEIEDTVVDNKVVSILEKYIGLPMAESTPNNAKQGPNLKPDRIKGDKDVLNSDEKSLNNKQNLTTKNEECPVESGNVTELKCVAKCFRNNIKHLSLTKPITVECCAHKQISDKDMQTSTINEIKTASIAIQTDECQENDDNVVECKIYPVYEDRRIIEYVKHSDLPDEPSLRSVGTNTDSDVRISQCNSFEYLYGVQISGGSKTHTNKTQSNSSSSSDGSKNERKGFATETDLSSKANPLAELISAKLSQHLVNDVEKSITILQKLLKSKKYDKVTKQYYVKKIVQKLIKCNYSSETSPTSVTPSETTDDNQNQGDIANLSNTDGPSKIPKTKEHQEAMPQMPVILNRNDNFKMGKRRQLDIKTFSSEILPEQPTVESSIKPKKSSKLKDARFTIATKYNQQQTSDELSQIGDVIPDNLPSLPSSRQTTMETSGSSRKSSFKNWKEHATKSEKLLEDKLNRIHSTDTTSDDSDLLNFAKKEREHQISWINNEINHLNKLKDMLQKKKNRKIPEVETLIQPQVEDMAEKNKTTSVYVITTERSNGTSTGSGRNSAKLIATKDGSKKCECLYAKSGSLPCDSSDCPILNYSSGKSSKRSNLDKYDVDNLPPLASFPGFKQGTGIENARLIASDIYPGKTPNSCVRRYVFEMPVSVEEQTDQRRHKELLHEKYISKPSIPKLPDFNIRTDSQNAKLIACEVCKGSLPNTCIRRYVFEIPVSDENVPSRRSSRACTPPCGKTPLTSSSYKKSSYCVESTCRHRRLDLLKPCDCKDKPPTRPCDCKDKLQTRPCDCNDKPPTRPCDCKDKPPRPCDCKEPKVMKDVEIQIDPPPSPAPPPSPPLPSLSRPSPPLSPPPPPLSPPPPPRPPPKIPSDVVCIYASDEDEDVESPNDQKYVSSDIPRGSQVGENKKSMRSQNDKNYGTSNIASGYQTGETKKTIGNQHDKNYVPPSTVPGYQMGENRKVVETKGNTNYLSSDIGRGYHVGESKNIVRSQDDQNHGPSDISYVYQIGENGMKNGPTGIVQADVVTDPNKEYHISIDKTKGGGAISYVEYSGTKDTEDLQAHVTRSPKKNVIISDQKTVVPSTVDDSNAALKKHQEYTDSDGAVLSSNADASSNWKRTNDESPSGEISSFNDTEDYPIDKSREKGDFTQKVPSKSANGGTSSLEYKKQDRASYGDHRESYDNKPFVDKPVSMRSGSAKTYQDQMIRDTEIRNHRKKLPEVDKKKHKTGPTRKSEQDTSSIAESTYTSPYSDKTITPTDTKTDDQTSLKTKDDEKSQETGEPTKGGEKPKKERVPIMCFRKKKEPPPPPPEPESSPTPRVADAPPTPPSSQDRGVNTNNVETATDSSESSDSSETLPRLCLCCNTAEAKYRSRLRGLPDQLQRALCDPCFIQNQQVTVPGTRPYYTYPGHVCCCYTMIKTETVRNIQRTVQELEDLDRERNLCSCTYGCKLHTHTGRRRKCNKAVAYTLTFEDVERTDSEDEYRRRHKRPPLEEVRVKVPHFVKKSKKDRENRKKSKHEKRKKHHKDEKETKTLTLQDHLVTNRPNFVASAEERRRTLIELAYMREERCQKYKQLLAMSNGVLSERNISNKSSKPHMFSSKEMKKITANNYKKLPEVQKKLEENRNQQIKRANKILSDMFNRKLRERVLKGQLSLSTNASVIKL